MHPVKVLLPCYICIMVEVFKTNVREPIFAYKLVEQIHQRYADYKANFDLEDCDRILRVKCTTGPVHASGLIALLNEWGFKAEVLPDEVIPTGGFAQDWSLQPRWTGCLRRRMLSQ
jgi:hypothetical protein